MTDTVVKDGAGVSGWAYTYDSAARLTQAVLAANGATPAVTYGYNYAGTGGCGADTGAGMDGARVGSSVKIGTAAATTTTSCTDFASRLTSATGAGSMVYNAHGDATTIGTQTFTYDSADRVIGGSAGGPNQTVAYTLDAAGRTVTRTGSGTATVVDVSTTTYSFTGGGDTADLQLTATNTIAERYLSLPGGALVTKRYAATGGDIWAFPNIHGDTACTTDAAGTLAATPAIYDPYGNPLAQATGVIDLTKDPTTRTNGLTDGWVGSHQRGAEHTGSANWILMGARIYLPGYGQFASADPIFGGNTNPYTYPTDPINAFDLDGMRHRKAHAAAVRYKKSHHLTLTTRFNLPNSRFFTGAINILYGSYKLGQGAFLLTMGTAEDVTGIGALLGLPTQAYGVYQVVSGGFRYYRGVNQLFDAFHQPMERKTPLLYGADIGLDLAPFGGTAESIIGGLP
jgi:RHS repeat-associated protein